LPEPVTANAKFQQKATRKWTWMAPDCKHTNTIDMILIKRRWQGAAIASDPSSFMCKIKLRPKMKTKKQDTED